MLRNLKSNSVWFLDFFAFIFVMPGVLSAANITELLHWALPNFSLYLIGLRNSDPTIVNGRPLFFDIKSAPNNFKGFVTLVKSLFERLLSPFIVIWFFEFISRPKINLARVPEFPASRTIFFFVLYPFSP